MSWKPFGRGAPSNAEPSNNYDKPRNQHQQNQGWNQNAPNNQGGGRGRGQNRGRGRGQRFSNFPDRYGNKPNNEMMDDDAGSSTPVFGSFGSNTSTSFGGGSTFSGFGGTSFGQPSGNTGSFGSTSASFGSSDGSVFGGSSFETFPKPNRNQWQSGNDSEMMADANEGFSGRGRGRGRGRGQNQDDSWRANSGRGRGGYQASMEQDEDVPFRPAGRGRGRGGFGQDDSMNDSESFVPNAGRGRNRRFGQQEQDMDMMDNADQGNSGSQFFNEGGRGRGRGRGRNYDQSEVEMTDYESGQGRGRGRGRGRADQEDSWRVKPGRGQTDQEDTWRANPGRGRGRGGYQATTMEQDEDVPFRPAGRGRGRGGFGQQEQDLEMEEDTQEKPWGRGRGRGRADQEESWRVKPGRGQSDQQDTWRVKPGRGRGRGDPTEPQTEGLFQKPFKRQQSFGEEQTTGRPAFAQNAEEDGDDDNHTLFFKGIPPIGLTEQHIRRITSGYGPVKKLVVNAGKRFAIVEYASKQPAINAKAKLKTFPLPDGGMARIKVFWSTKSVDEASLQKAEEAPERPTFQVTPRSPEFDMPVARPKKPVEANPKQGRQGSFLGRDNQPVLEEDTPGRSVFDDEDLMRKTQRGQRFSPVAQPKFSAASPKTPAAGPLKFTVQQSEDEEDTQEDDGAEERLLIHSSSAKPGGGPKFNITFGDTAQPKKPATEKPPKPALNRLLSASLRGAAGKDTEEEDEKPQPVPAQPAEQPRKPVMFVVPERKPKPAEPEPEGDEGEDFDEGEGDYDEEEDGEDYDEEGEEGFDEEGEEYDQEEEEGEDFDEEEEAEGAEADYDADHGDDEEGEEEGDEGQSDEQDAEQVKPPSFVRRSPVAIKPPETQRGVGRPTSQMLPPRGASKELRQRIDEFLRQIKTRPKPKSRVVIPEGKLVGYCQEKCPEPERYDRERTKDLSLFEMVPGTERTSLPSVKHEWAVKKYKRPSGKLDQQPEYLPEEVRPGPILLMTTDYLVENILDRTDRPFLEVHNFVRDRARSVRQDFTIQGLFNEETLAIYERMARFHIFSDQLLCEEDASNFDPGQNTEQLDKVLISCREMYDNFRPLGIECPNEPEFRAYLLFIVEEEGEFFNLLKSVPEAVFAAPEVQFAVKARLALQDNNYVLYFKMTKQADYLMACLMHKYFTNVRKKALKTMTRSYRDLIPFSTLTRVMMFESEEDAANFCTYHGLSKTDEGIPKGSSFIEPKMAIGRVKSSYIEAKRGPFKLSDIVNLTPSQRAEFLKTEVEEEPVNIQVTIPPRVEPKVSLRQSGKAQPAAVKEPSPTPAVAPALRVSRKVKPTEVTPPKPAAEAPKIGVSLTAPTPSQRPPSPAVKAPSFTFPVLAQPAPIPATPKFDFNSLPKLDDAFVTTPVVSFPPPSVPKVAPTPTTSWLQPLPVPQTNVPSAPSPLRRSMDKPPQMRPTTPVLSILEPDEALSVSSEESKHVEPAWEPSVEDLPIVEEPQGPSLEERLEEYLAAKRHDLASRAFNAWRYWAAERVNERMAVEKAAKRAMRTRPMRLISPKPASMQGQPIDYDYYVNTQQRQEAFQKILASLRQRADVRRKEYWSAIDLPKIIFPLLRKKNSRQHSLFWKLVVVADGAQPVSNQLDSESLDNPNISDWLVAKFSRGGVDLPDTVDQLPILSLYKSEWNDLNLDDNFEEDTPQENTSLRVCVKLVNDIQNNNKKSLQHELQGTHCLLYYFPPADKMDNAYWKKHLSHLEKLINSLHPHSQAPLLLVFPTNSNDAEINQTINHFKALFAEKLPRKVISQFCFMFVPKTNESKALSKRNKKLAKGVKWLAEHTSKQPKLASYYLKDVLESKVELLLANMSQRQKQTEFIKYVKPAEAEAIQPEIYVNEFNTQISHIIDELNDNSNRDVAFWPVPEFTVRLNDEDTDLSEQLPPADWNTDSYFNAVQSAVDSILLPDFTYTDDVTDEQGLISCCLNYLKKLDFGSTNWSANILPLANHIHYLLLKRRQKESETKRRAAFPWLQIFEAIFYFRLAQNEKKYQHQKVAFVRSSKFKDYRKQLQEAYIESLVAPSAARLAGLLSMAAPSAAADRPIVLLDDMLTGVNKKEESDQVQEKKRSKIDEIIARQKQTRNELENLLHEIEREKLKSKLIQLEVDQKIKDLMPSSASLALISSSPMSSSSPNTPRKVPIESPVPSVTPVMEDISMGEESVQEETDIVQAVIKRQERKRKLYENLFSQIEEEKRKYRRLEHMTDKYE